MAPERGKYLGPLSVYRCFGSKAIAGADSFTGFQKAGSLARGDTYTGSRFARFVHFLSFFFRCCLTGSVSALCVLLFSRAFLYFPLHFLSAEERCPVPGLCRRIVGRRFALRSGHGDRNHALVGAEAEVVEALDSR